MKLIKKIHLSAFRSIKSSGLDKLGHLSVLAGLNNSGKSNFLRALSAFFTNRPDPGSIVNVDFDYYRPELLKKKKKRIRITVEFTLPDEFRFRKGLEGVKQLLGEQFAITKEWTREDIEPRVFLNYADESLNANDRERVAQFLSLISFRYVPNRVLPLDVIKQEHQALRDVLIRRLSRGAENENQIFDTMAKTSKKMIQLVSAELSGQFSDISDVRLATPSSLAEMVFAFGYRLDEGGSEFEDTVQGSGLQSFLMFQTLNLIDRDYFQKFGWRQAAIWAVEEPESSLHHSLEAATAAFLKRISNERKSRLQIVATTHSDLMVQYADRGYFVEKSDDGSVATASALRALLGRTSKAGVSRWIHPILYHHIYPLLLVEGEQDRLFLDQCLRLLGKHQKCIVTYLGELAGASATGGVQALFRYAKDNADAIKSRPSKAPVVVVLDWDASSQKGRFQKLFTKQDPFRVLVWPETEANPKLGKSFRGYERFLSTRLIKAAIRKGAVIGKTRQGKYIVSSSDYAEAKRVLSRLVQKDLREDDLEHCSDFLRNVLSTLGN